MKQEARTIQPPPSQQVVFVVKKQRQNKATPATTKNWAAYGYWSLSGAAALGWCSWLRCWLHRGRACVLPVGTTSTVVLVLPPT